MSIQTPDQDAVASSADTPPRGRRRDAASNREALIRAAQTLLAQDANASLDAIAQGAGLSRRALYGHFADRDALIGEVIAVCAEQFNAIAALANDPDPRAGLARLAASLWSDSVAVRAAASIALDVCHTAAIQQALSPLRRRVRGIVADGASQGVFREDIPAETIAMLVEESARVAVRADHLDLMSDAAAMTVVKVVLSIAGLSWREQTELLAQNHDIFPDQKG